ncbi:MAG: hypothetical protein HZC36_00255 [Armatimonadetes bacterium]|nr:hypothetical protein [Armatimonadota bacterium]
MEPSQPSKKRFSEKQVAKILRRASEIQQTEGSTPATEGIGGSELVEIGSELGLDKSAIRQAIEEVQAAEAGGSATVGGPIRVEEAMTLDGPLNSERWEALTAELRHAFGRAGKTNKVGDVYEWSGGENELDTIHVSALSVDGKTKLRINSSMDSLLWLNLILNGLFSLMITAIVLTKSPLPIAGKLLTLVALLACLFSIVRWLLLGACRRRKAAIRRVIAKARMIFESDHLRQAAGSDTSLEATAEGVDQRLQG